MSIQTTFEDIELNDLMDLGQRMKDQGCRCVQMFCTNTPNGIDLTYSFDDKDGVLKNFRICGVTKQTPVPSLQGLFLSLFPFENEAHDLFGVDVQDMVLDFAGNFYALATPEPMTVISPQEKARREKAAAKAKPAASDANDAAALEAKLAKLSPEKAEKVRAALKAQKEKEERDRMEEKIKDLPPEDQEKFRYLYEQRLAKAAEHLMDEKKKNAEGQGK